MNFRKYFPEDSERVVELLNKCLKRKENHKITKESFEWKHFDRFFRGRTVAFLAEAEEQIVSFVCFTPLALNNQEIFWNCNIQATDSKFRRKGLVTKLTKMCEQNITEITQKSQNNFVGFSNEDGIKIDQNSKIINHAILGQFIQLKILPNPINIISKVLFKTNQNNLCTIDNEFSKSYLTWSKNKAYVKWKYENNPKLIYTKLRFNSNEIYLKKSRFAIEICDIISLDNTNTGDNVMNIIDFVRKEYPAKIITICYLDNQVTKSIFAQKPRLSICKKLPIYLTVLSGDSVLLDNDKWLLFGGDII
jgi:hypothetical protein